MSSPQSAWESGVGSGPPIAEGQKSTREDIRGRIWTNLRTNPARTPASTAAEERVNFDLSPALVHSSSRSIGGLPTYRAMMWR